MTDRPILFSAPMVRALLDGRKTQTRELLRLAATPKFRRGDRLWVREQHYLTDDGYSEAVIHTADDDAVTQHHSDIARMQARYGMSDKLAESHLRIRSPIHMPRWASRLTLVVTDVRVQRLQEISEADAKAEGVTEYAEGFAVDGRFWGPTATKSFQYLWDDINAGRGFCWDDDPCVAALTFTVHKCNIDQMEKSE